jgi:hypothetical protein
VHRKGLRRLQHLRNYADAASRHNNLGSPFEARIGYNAAAFDTFRYKGQAPTWVQLNGKWAVPGTTYGQTILSICNDIRAFHGLTPLPGAQSSGVSATDLDAAYEQLRQETTSRN